MSVNKRDIEDVKQSILFDADWYVNEYPDVSGTGIAPIEHYLRYGVLLGRVPAPLSHPSFPLKAPAYTPNRFLFHALMREIADKCGDPELLLNWEKSEQALQGAPMRRSKTLVSVIMPTFDRGFIIGEAIASVLAQTHDDWELIIIDDGSRDDTRRVVERWSDSRIQYRWHSHQGAGSARNYGIARSKGQIIAYLDSDNVWHPRYLERIVDHYNRAPGTGAIRANYVTAGFDGVKVCVTRYQLPAYSYDELSLANYIDLNTFSHRRSLLDLFDGFNEALRRLQDWDLVLRYLFFQDPASIDNILAIHRQNVAWSQISSQFSDDRTCENNIASTIRGYYASGVPVSTPVSPAKVTVLSWDVSRNHFSKAYNICEAISVSESVALTGFQFFEDPIFPPYANAQPCFRMQIYPGCMFPKWLEILNRAVDEVDGDVVYAVKPRLPSFGMALLAQHRQRKPFVLEINDLESAAALPVRGQWPEPLKLEDVDPSDPELLNPYSQLWSRILEGLAPEVPVRITHNSALDARFGAGAFFVRNPKDEAIFDPRKWKKSEVRAALGISAEDEVILFGGLVREHKGVFELVDFARKKKGRRKVLFVASRHSPELEQIRQAKGNGILILGSTDRNDMARITAAADAVVLWLDPEFAASRYQMPFKLTDALAMKVPVVANPIGDLEALGREGIVSIVPYGDLDGLAAAMTDLRRDRARRRTMVEAGRRLYVRQYSYAATRVNFRLATAAAQESSGMREVADRFASFFDMFCEAQCR